MKSKIGFYIMIGILLTAVLYCFKENQAQASEVTLPAEYYFVLNGQHKQAGTEYEIKSPEVVISVDSGAWEPTTTVEWVSSELGVVSLENTSYGENYIKLVRNGPGYSTITAILRQGTSSYSLSFLVKVDLQLDSQRSGLIMATTTKERILIIDDIAEEKQIYLKYIDYETEVDPVAVTGAAISASAVIWESDNEGVATVDETGLVTSVGSGSANITVTSNTMSLQDRPMQVSLKVVVKPEFEITYDNAAGQHIIAQSVDSNTINAPAQGVPSDFFVNSNASMAENLKWEIYDFSTGKKILQTDTSKMTYSVSTISGNLSFENVKAGTYEIYAFADTTYNANTNAPYAYLKVIVPIDFGEKNVIMTVGDTYSILENSNIPGANIFEYYYDQGNSNIAAVNNTTGIITARRNGTARLRLVYKTAQNLYDIDDVFINEIFINVTIIDGIALSTTSATIYTAGSLLLNALVTDPTQPIIWSSSDPTIVTVVNGLVTGKKAGSAIITARQTINGIAKKATCEITVQLSVATITVNPAVITLPIGAYQTLHATITPQNLSGVILRWQSSNDAIVTVVESSALTATVQGVAGGHAVISAINQDNVVVGYCHVSVQQSVTSIVLSETGVFIALNTNRLQLRATVYPENALNKAVTWTSTDPAKAKVDSNGLVTLLKPGTVTILAVSADNPKATAMCNLTILIPVVSVAMDEKEKIMYVGQTTRLSYTLLPANANNNSVIWTTTNSKVATVDATGKVSAKSVGTTVIILKTLDGGFSVYCTLTVKRTATGVKFDVSDLELKAGQSYNIITTMTPKDSTDNALVWESSDTKVAVVDDTGKVVAKAAGKAIIMARTESGGVTYCKVTVTQPVDGLLLNFSEKTIYIGDVFKLKVSVSPSEASELGVTWKSSNPKVATISENGEIEAFIGGVTVITCTTIDGGFAATCVITVKELVTIVKLDYENYSLGIGKTVKLTATVSNETATNQKVTWTSSNENVATVTSNGKVTGLSIGYANITAIAQDGSEVEAVCEVRVVTPVTGITLDKSYLDMMVGESKSLKVTIKPSNSTYKKATWTSGDNSIAIVDEDGVVTALKAGSTTIMAEAQDSSGKKAICAITIRDRVPATGITLMDKKLVMVPGEEKLVRIALNPINSTETDSISWSSDNSAVAKVDKKTGNITAKATGTANITVMTSSGKTAIIEVTVIGLNITELTLEQYTTYQYPLQVEGATTKVSWSVENPAVAQVTNGVVSSRAVGTTTITATVNGRKLSCKLTVVRIS